MIKVKSSQILNRIRTYKMKYHYLRSLLICAIIIAMAAIEIFAKRSYFDEVLAIVSMGYIIFSRKKIARYDIIAIIMLISVITIGIISNILSGITSDAFSIIVDIIAETKLLVVYFAAKYFATDDVKNDVVYLLTPISKLFCVSAFICAIMSIFVNIGMSSSERYGFNSFKFIFPQSFQYVAVYMLVFGVLISNKRTSETSRFIYICMAIVSLLLATKGPPIIFSSVFVVLFIYFGYFKKVKIWVLIPLAVIIVLLGGFQIQTYLLNTNSPRYLFFKYSFVTANDNFPFGSGFSTFGSDQAARVYSPLYYRYGFNKMQGMNPDDSSFLSDTFWPMAIGQFGWIGSALYLGVYIMIFFSFGKNKYFTRAEKAFIYACFIQYMVHGVGAAILSSSAGMIGFIALGLFTAAKTKSYKNTENLSAKHKKRYKINIKR